MSAIEDPFPLLFYQLANQERQNELMNLSDATPCLIHKHSRNVQAHHTMFLEGSADQADFSLVSDATHITAIMALDATDVMRPTPPTSRISSIAHSPKKTYSVLSTFRPRYLANIQSLVAKEEQIDAQSRLNGLQNKMGQILEEKVEEEAKRVHRCPAAALEAVSGAHTCESEQARAQISCSPPKK